MRPAAAERARRAVVRASRRWRSCALILLYHRVADASFDPQLLCVSPKHFAEHLEVLVAGSHVTALAAVSRQQALPRRTVAVTFDDGYADNLHAAQPLLERAGVPATVFVTTGCLGAERGFWWDRLEESLLHPGNTRDPLVVKIGDDRYEWGLGEAARYDQEAFDRDRQWTVLASFDPTTRHAAYRALHRILRPLDGPARDDAVVQIEAQTAPHASGRNRPRILSRDELPQLVASGVVSVGAHSVTHPTLASLTPERQDREITGSKRSLEDVLGRPVTSFAYPYGSPLDYSNDTVALARRAGFECACTTRPAAVRRGVDVFRLPRLIVRDWDGEEFARRLDDWFLT